MNDFEHFEFDISAVVDPQSTVSDDQYRVLRRLCIPPRFNNPSGAPLKRGLVVDVETTGRSEDDDVIQLAMLAFDYEVDTNRIIDVYKEQAFNQIREPAVPISKEASLVHKLTDEMVAGHTIDEQEVEAIVNQVDFVIAHNARFDRPMVEKHWPCFKAKPWGCSWFSVNWIEEGFSAGKLDYLGAQFGFFFEAHRALSDCEACVGLLAQTLPTSQKRVLNMVREASQRPDYLIRAIRAPFDKKDLLKNRGYRWRDPALPHGKVWWTISPEPDEEIAWLQSEIYETAIDLPVHKINALTKYSNRMWESL